MGPGSSGCARGCKQTCAEGARQRLAWCSLARTFGCKAEHPKVRTGARLVQLRCTWAGLASLVTGHSSLERWLRRGEATATPLLKRNSRGEGNRGDLSDRVRAWNLQPQSAMYPRPRLYPTSDLNKCALRAPWCLHTSVQAPLKTIRLAIRVWHVLNWHLDGVTIGRFNGSSENVTCCLDSYSFTTASCGYT